MRRLPTLGALLVALGALLALVAPPVSAQDAEPFTVVPTTIVDIIEVDGLLDPVMVAFILRSIADVQVDGQAVEGRVGLILQMNSSGAVVSDAELAEVVVAMRSSPVPVSVWVGPSGSGLTGASAVLGGHAAYLGIAPGSRWGLGGTTVDPALLEGTVRVVPVEPVSSGEARDLELSSFDAPTVGDFLVNLPEVEKQQIEIDGQPRLQPVTEVRFGQLSLVDQLMHTVASPPVAYLLLVIGLALMIFELFTAGVGVAGVVGAVSFVLGCYGLAVLPTRPWAAVLIVASMVAFAVDVQTGVPRFWTIAGGAMFVVGSIGLYDGFPLSWITLLVAFIGVALTFGTGMPSMVRTRFSTPTIGREWMIGEMGRAVTAVAPDGIVRIRDAQWRAFTNRATPIEELDRVRVVGIEGLVLEVEPEEGAARDYRDRSPKD